jgi:hypothetical protein
MRNIRIFVWFLILLGAYVGTHQWSHTVLGLYFWDVVRDSPSIEDKTITLVSELRAPTNQGAARRPKEQEPQMQNGEA